VVREFKTDKHILNFQNQIDEIVGRKTVVELDKELPPADPGPAPTPTQNFIDVVVRFLPGTHGEKRDDAALDGIDLTKTNRRVRTVTPIGRGTALIRQAARPLILQVAKAVEDARNANGFTPGIVCIYGSSSGGRAALDLASELSKRGIPIAYVGVLDAAFFPQETTTVPLVPRQTPGQPRGGRPRNFPIFVQSPEIVADTKRSFFQTFGNHVKDIDGTLRWTSSMDIAGLITEEIHGNVQNFEPVDRSISVKAGDRGNDDGAHDAVIGIANAEAQRDIENKLAAQTPLPPPL
jgi:hypothetical protein